MDLFDPQYCFEAFSTLHPKAFKNDNYALWRKLNTRACDFLSRRFHFDAFSTVFTYAICIRVSVLIHFRERIQIDALSMKTISVLVLGGPAQRIEMYVFSIENARKRISVDARAYLSFPGVSYMPLI